MRKFISLLCAITLLLTLCACANKNSTNSSMREPSSAITITESKPQESKEETVSSKPESSQVVVSEVESEVESNVESVKDTSKKEEKTSSKDETTEKKNESTPKKKKPTTKKEDKKKNNKKNNSSEEKNDKKKDQLPKFKYTVKDPKNLKGLSTKKKGFGFGIAENGKPHELSIENQQKFDNYKNVEALALDTKTKKKVMYLTFDNGYEYKNLTADILDTLKEKKVKAAFFITLSYAKNNKTLVKRMIDEGHIVGNHSANHPSFPNLTRKEMAKEIAELDNYLRKNFSYTSPYFRFPAGEYSENSLELVTSIGFKSVFWSAAYSDWDTNNQKGKKYAYETITSRFHPGAVILLHAVSKDNAKALGKIIDKAKDEGYTFKTLDYYFK